jgi:hypothetical protein
MVSHTLPWISMNKQTNFEGREQILLVSPRPSNSLYAMLKNTLKLEQWTNRNQELRQ